MDGGWRRVGRGLAAWFETASLTEAAELVRRVAAVGVLPPMEVRPGGVRVRLAPDDVATAERISAVVARPGEPAALQEMRIVFEAEQPAAIREFWRAGFGYEGDGAGALVDPWGRDPEVVFVECADAGLLGDRVHVDVVRPERVVEEVRAGRRPAGAWGVLLTDAEGNQLDLVPGGVLAPEASDWQTLFAAMTFYPTTKAVELVTAVAELADAAGVAVMLDVRPEGVLIDHGKDVWEEGGSAFVEFAVQVQTTARGLGLSAEPEALRFVQLGIAAVDVPAVQRFWTEALGYVQDGDSYDPRRLNPGFIFQQTAAHERRNRIRLELDVPADQLENRVQQAIRAGGRLGERRTVTDPEGNELSFVSR